MSTAFEVWLDEERQIIRQRLHGEPDLATFLDIIVQTDACAQNLRQPTDVRILVDGDWSGRMNRGVRSEATKSLRRPELKRMAIVNSRGMVRVVLRFMSIAIGIDKIRAFPNEASALAWLLS